MNKVLIVEDEAGLRNGIANAFSWAEMGCELYALAGTGIEALEICLTNQPDIIISDIVMPGIDGLSLLKYIKDKYPAIHFIIVTGHRNFEYAKNALNLGAEFFILKPIDYDELKAAIQKLSDEIIRKNEEKQMENERERILRDVLSGHIILKGALSPQGQKILDDLRFFRVCAIKFDDENNDDYFRNLQLMTFYQNLIKPSNVILARADNSCVVIILVLPDINDDLTDAQVYFTQLQEKTYEFFHVSVSIGISEIQQGYQSAKKGYVQALRALGLKFFSGNQSINIFRVQDGNSASTVIMDYQSIIYYSKKSVELLSHNSSLHLNQAASNLFDEFICSFQNHHPSFIKSSFLVLCILCLKKVVGEDNRYLALLLEKYANFQKIIISDSLEDLRALFINLLLELGDYLSVKSSNKEELMQRILSFITKNFQTRISLGDIAKAVYLSPTYLSSLITNETGKSFTDILNDVRIQNAIELMKDPKRKLSEIAISVGFNDPQYFSTIFKKHTGLTPRLYRELYLSGQMGIFQSLSGEKEDNE